MHGYEAFDMIILHMITRISEKGLEYVRSQSAYDAVPMQIVRSVS